MIQYICDITNKVLTKEEMDNTKHPLHYEVKMNGKNIVMRATFCVDNEGCGELSNEGIREFLFELINQM